MMVSNRNLLFQGSIFRGKLLVSGRVIYRIGPEPFQIQEIIFEVPEVSTIEWLIVGLGRLVVWDSNRGTPK